MNCNCCNKSHTLVATVSMLISYYDTNRAVPIPSTRLTDCSLFKNCLAKYYTIYYLKDTRTIRMKQVKSSEFECILSVGSLNNRNTTLTKQKKIAVEKIIH